MSRSCQFSKRDKIKLLKKDFIERIRFQVCGCEVRKYRWIYEWECSQICI